jgi:hypothetical protein
VLLSPACPGYFIWFHNPLDGSANHGDKVLRFAYIHRFFFYGRTGQLLTEIIAAIWRFGSMPAFLALTKFESEAKAISNGRIFFSVKHLQPSLLFVSEANGLS